MNTNQEYIVPFADGAGRITSLVGNRKDPVGGFNANHKGLDIGMPVGVPIYAAREGKVFLVREETTAGKGFGNYIVVQHSDGEYSLYGHLSKMDVKRGDTVEQGALIGLSGNTGKTTGPHLHFQITKGYPRETATVEVINPLDVTVGLDKYLKSNAQKHSVSNDRLHSSDLETVVHSNPTLDHQVTKGYSSTASYLMGLTPVGPAIDMQKDYPAYSHQSRSLELQREIESFKERLKDKGHEGNIKISLSSELNSINPNKIYSGKIVDKTEGYTLQEIGANHYVVHDNKALSQDFSYGKHADISYQIPAGPSSEREIEAKQIDTRGL